MTNNNDRIDALFQQMSKAVADTGTSLEDAKVAPAEPTEPALVPVSTWDELIDHASKVANEDAARREAEAEAEPEPTKERNTALEEALARALGISVEVYGDDWEPKPGWKLYGSHRQGLRMATYDPGNEDEGMTDHFFIHRAEDFMYAVNHFQGALDQQARRAELLAGRPKMPSPDTVQLSRSEWWFCPSDTGQYVTITVNASELSGVLMPLSLNIDEARKLRDALDEIYDAPDDTRVSMRYQVQVTDRSHGYIVLGRDITWGSNLIKGAVGTERSRVAFNMDRKEAAALTAALGVQITYMALMATWGAQYKAAGGWLRERHDWDDEPPF